MATIVLSAVGAAVGGSIGGTLAGLSSVAIGRAVGATLGKVIDQQLMGQGSDVVETGRVDRFRLTSASEGDPVAQIYGRMRVGGQVIWASAFREVVAQSGGGKGAPSRPATRDYSYSVSLAIALCAGQILRVGRVWADGEELAADDLNMRVYTGTPDQLPDPTIEAVEGAGMVPAYRGTAYVVMDDLALQRFGNRVPQFSFEVVRAEQPDEDGYDDEMAQAVQGVALIPGTGEYALATTPVYYADGKGGRWSANVNTPAGKPDFVQSLEVLDGELHNCGAVSVVVSWFGDDLRCDRCTIRPKVERKNAEGENMPWAVSGLTRALALEIAEFNGRPVYGGTTADAAVVEAIRALNDAGKAVMFYPFLLMDQLAGNTLTDPYSEVQTQPALPWRGRITTSKAVGQAGSPDGSAAAAAEVAAFVGTVTAADFTLGDGTVTYTGPEEWSLSRFILHYAALCAAAGGVDAFCIGSELRGLSQVRGAGNSFPFVQALRALTAEVRNLVGAETKIGYAADWSEYFGYQPRDGSGDVFFHLDPLWADDQIDFIGIDNYMPMSDWREGAAHLDADWGEIYNLDYLRSNIEGGEGYAWYYHSGDARNAQIRTPITDGAYDEPWVYRYKDMRNWWQNTHHERVGGARSELSTAWEPQSKPFWFTEMGCAAVDKGTNQPNKFLDAKSSESDVPYYSDGTRDDLIQKRYLRAMYSYWSDESHNPTSAEYGAPMLDLSHSFVWAWDTRPYPFFPNNTTQWSDGENYTRGHWINGRTGARTLASVVGEICENAGLSAYDTSALHGYVRGYVVGEVGDARASLQPLMLRYGFDAIERDGVLSFRQRGGQVPLDVPASDFALSDEMEGTLDHIREAEAEMAGRVRLRFVQADGNFETIAEEAVLPDQATHAVATSEVALAMTRAEGRQVAERWLIEARVARDAVRVALPPSRMAIGAGDVIALAGEGTDTATYRVDRAEQGTLQMLEAVRIEPGIYLPSNLDDALAKVRNFVQPVPVSPLFLDLPLMTGDEVPHAPHLAVTANPWPGTVAVYSAPTDEDYSLNTIIAQEAVIGLTQSPLVRHAPAIWDDGDALEVRLLHGTLSAASEAAVLNGRNLCAIGDGSSDNWELFQFQDAELIGPDSYLLRRRLRGQLGTDALMPDAWPAGSWVVLLNGTPGQIEMATHLRRVAQHYRIGPAQRGLDDPSFVARVQAFDGNGLRPYAPVHLRVNLLGPGDVQVTWIRRTRIDGDGWDTPEVPLGEDVESYRVRVLRDGAVLREETVGATHWIYGAAEQAADAALGGVDVEVAQLSTRYGAGLAGRITVAL
jgi:hypothetical protein